MVSYLMFDLIDDLFLNQVCFARFVVGRTGFQSAEVAAARRCNTKLTDRIDSTAPVVIPAPLWVTGGSGMIFPVTEDVFQKN